MRYTEKAYAKINLHLNVLNKRDDGFHDLLGLMASVSLYDLLKLDGMRVKKSLKGITGVSLTCSGGSHCDVITQIPEEDNLITRSALLYMERVGAAADLSFTIEKNIPSGAGLGGGSSDAAAALRIMNACFHGVPEHELRGIGAELGADVPYCISGGFAICEGTGDIIESINGTLDCLVLIINSGEHINTGQAFAMLNRGRQSTLSDEMIAERKDKFRSALQQGSLERLTPWLSNDFEEAVFRQHPVIGNNRKRLYELGADYAALTGSGSSLIGLFRDRQAAINAQAVMKGSVRDSVLAEFI